jgi:hypothetical protein
VASNIPLMLILYFIVSLTGGVNSARPVALDWTGGTSFCPLKGASYIRVTAYVESTIERSRKTDSEIDYAKIPVNRNFEFIRDR